MNCDFRGYDYEDDLSEGELPRATHIVWDGCKIQYGGRLITPHRYNDYWKVKNSVLKNAASAIYAINAPDYLSANNVTIEKNQISDLGVPANGYDDGDNHAVGVQGCSNWIIQNNYIENTGSAIEFWNGASPGKYMRDNTIRWNFIKNTKAMQVTLGDGIKISGENGNTLGFRTGFKIYGNIIINPEGFGIGSNNPDQELVFNNLIVGAGNHSIRESVSSNYPPSMIIKNNIIINNRNRSNTDFEQYFIFIHGNSSAAWSEVEIDNNIYYPNADVGNQFLGFNIGYVNFSAWKTRTPFDRNGIAADPKLVSYPPSTPMDSKLQAISPAIDAGANVDMQSDFFGKPIPFNGRPDIGPFEYSPQSQVGPSAPRGLTLKVN